MPSELPALDATTRAQLRQWLDQWKRVGPVLEAERLERLRNLADEQAARDALAVWPMGTVNGYRGGDDAEGLRLIKSLQAKLARR